jgi:hypothetical protein
MKAVKKKALEKKGYTVGGVDQFLCLTKEESETIKMKLALAQLTKLKPPLTD